MRERQDSNKNIRLKKFLAESGVCSSREADRVIAGGSFIVDGKNAVIGM